MSGDRANSGMRKHTIAYTETPMSVSKSFSYNDDKDGNYGFPRKRHTSLRSLITFIAVMDVTATDQEILCSSGNLVVGGDLKVQRSNKYYMLLYLA